MLNLIRIRIPYIGTVEGVVPTVAARERRRLTSSKDKSKAGRYHRSHGCVNRDRGENLYRIEGELAKAARALPAPEPVEPMVVVSPLPFSTAVGDDAALEAREKFALTAVEADRAEFAVGKWGIRRFVS